MTSPEARLARLTARQFEVLRVVCERGSVKEAAWSLGITHNTAKNHLSAVYERLNVPSLGPACLLVGLAGMARADQMAPFRRLALVRRLAGRLRRG